MPSTRYINLAEFSLFPSYNTPGIYRALTGNTAPPFNPAYPPKYWEDPLAPNLRTIVYPRGLVVNIYGGFERNADGSPMVAPLSMLRVQAISVNIPDNVTNAPGTDMVPIPCPFKELTLRQRLVFRPGPTGGYPVVEDLDFEKEPSDESNQALLIEIRDILVKVATRLGI